MPVLIVWIGRHIYIRTPSVLNGEMIYVYVYIEVYETLIEDHWSFESMVKLPKTTQNYIILTSYSDHYVVLYMHVQRSHTHVW